MRNKPYFRRNVLMVIFGTTMIVIFTVILVLIGKHKSYYSPGYVEGNIDDFIAASLFFGALGAGVITGSIALVWKRRPEDSLENGHVSLSESQVD